MGGTVIGIEFLSFDDLMEIHSDQLARYGGSEGFVDRNVVESALAQPQASMFGAYLHVDVAEMAAAYLFHFAASQALLTGTSGPRPCAPASSWLATDTGLRAPMTTVRVDDSRRHQPDAEAGDRRLDP